MDDARIYDQNEDEDENHSRWLDPLDSHIKSMAQQVDLDRDKVIGTELFENLIASGVVLAVDTFIRTESEPTAQQSVDFRKIVVESIRLLTEYLTLHPEATEVAEVRNRMTASYDEDLKALRLRMVEGWTEHFNLPSEIIDGTRSATSEERERLAFNLQTTRPSWFTGFIYERNNPTLKCRCLMHAAMADSAAQHQKMLATKEGEEFKPRTWDDVARKAAHEFGGVYAAALAMADDFLAYNRRLYQGEGDDLHGSVDPNGAQEEFHRMMGRLGTR